MSSSEAAKETKTSSRTLIVFAATEQRAFSSVDYEKRQATLKPAVDAYITELWRCSSSTTTTDCCENNENNSNSTTVRVMVAAASAPSSLLSQHDDELPMTITTSSCEKNGEGAPSFTVTAVKNACMDFGMHWRVLKATIATARQTETPAPCLSAIDRVILANDSCYAVHSLRPFFDYFAREKTTQTTHTQSSSHVSPVSAFWGLTASPESRPHVQSYFLVFDGKDAVEELASFVRQNDVTRFEGASKERLVDAFEVGLSKHMMESGRRIACSAAFSVRTLINQVRIPEFLLPAGYGGVGVNPAYVMWDRLLLAGCPLIKRVKQQRFGADDLLLHVASSPFKEALQAEFSSSSNRR